MQSTSRSAPMDRKWSAPCHISKRPFLWEHARKPYRVEALRHPNRGFNCNSTCYVYLLSRYTGIYIYVDYRHSLMHTYTHTRAHTYAHTSFIHAQIRRLRYTASWTGLQMSQAWIQCVLICVCAMCIHVRTSVCVVLSAYSYVCLFVSVSLFQSV